MFNFMQGLTVMAGRRAAELRAIITLFILHFVIMVFGQVAISCYVQQVLHPANAYFAIAWPGVAILAGWIFGGWPIGLVFGAYVGSNIGFFRALSRVVIGFVAVETFINVFACVLPLYVNFGVTGFLLLTTAGYFLYRILGGIDIDWNLWAKVPRAGIALAVGILVYQAWFSTSGMPAFPLPDLMDPESWLYIILCVAGISWLMGLLQKFRMPGSTPAPAAPAQGGHNDHH